MVYKVNLSKKAKKQFSVLPKAVQVRMAHALREIGSFPDSIAKSYALQKPLTGYKRRVGKYRILFDVEGKDIVVRYIGLRADAYKR